MNQPSTTPAHSTWLGIATALGCPGDDRRKVRAAQGRMAALGYTKACGRCGGGGNYSYCPSHGTVCFKCNGSGKEFVRITAKILAEARARQDAGELEGYFARSRAVTEARRALAPMVKTLEEEWAKGPVHASYAALRRVDSTLVVASAEFRAVNLINEICRGARDLESPYTRLPADLKLSRMADLLEMVREVNAAWAAYTGPDRITEVTGAPA